jgi:sulfate adenylyltransferase large subunit
MSAKDDLVTLDLETSSPRSSEPGTPSRAARSEEAVGFSPLNQRGTEGASAPASDLAANGAPSGEPESWNSNIALHNPHLGQTPEPEPIQVSAEFAENFDVDDYLAEERGKDLLRFSTAGSVDDGKSTLIGRLLYDTQSVYDDQISSIEGKGTTAPGVLDLALLTDGLRAEREQGITIDVAYRYFSTARRKFIIADTPGHEQYTRNMATGASTADVAVVLVDARKGVLIQSRRHAYITALLGVRNVIVAVNKMDLVDYSADVFTKIQADFTRFFRDLDVDGNDQTILHFVPVSALAGDNVVHRSTSTPWYQGSTLLGLLESIPSSQVNIDAPFRMAVQRVIRPNLDFRGFAGQIAAGIIRVGDAVTALPSGKQSKVSRIVTYDGDLPEAFAPLSVTLTLEDEIDISRGDLLVTAAEQPVIAKGFTASLVWMDETPLELSKRYLLKQGSRSVPAQISTLLRTVDLSEIPGQASQQAAAATLSMNGIGNVIVEALQPLAFDSYAANRHTGSFVLIDLQTNATVAAGMIRKAETTTAQTASQITKDVVLHPSHTLRLQGSEDAVAVALEALRSAGALKENA